MQKKLIKVDWAGSSHPVWVVDQFDGFLDEFAREVGGKLDDERCPFGVLLWPSARVLAQALADKAYLRPQSALLIVELGCGVGFLSCVLARLFPEAEIWACDYEAGLGAMVALNAQAWGVEDRVRFHAVDWRQAVPAAWRSRCDWVVGTDVFYDDSHLQHLPPYAAELLKAGGQLTLADPQRYRFGQAMSNLAQFFQLLQHEKIPCSMQQEGIEDFMINCGIQQQDVSILNLQKLPAS